MSTPLDKVLQALQERAKELNCLYRVDEILGNHDTPTDEVFRSVMEALPSGWQYPGLTRARIVFRGQSYEHPDFSETAWSQSVPISVQGETVGSVSVHLQRAMPQADEGPFLKDERKLIEAVAERLSQFVQHRELSAVYARIGGKEQTVSTGSESWRIILDLLSRTDPNLLRRIARKMLNHLSVSGIAEAKTLLLAPTDPLTDEVPDENRPLRRLPPREFRLIAEETFKIAAEHLSEQEVFSCLQVWIKEDKVNFLVNALESSYTSLVEIANVLERFNHSGVDARGLSTATQVGVKVALTRRLLTDDPEFLNVSRKHLEIGDFFDVIRRTIVIPKSHGRIGGKSSGLYLAGQIVKRSPQAGELLKDIKTPRTWYLPSDGIVHFVTANNLEDVYNWRYREIDQIREEYPHIVEVFKNSRFPPDIVSGLSTALDDFGDRPLIVRSSSLLEDRHGSAFSGKYKSLFLANQGDKASRLAALLDAVAEVYASVFGPDPIQYRAERGLLEYHEEMAIMIQEVVGARAGRYFLPAFSGVGFSQNELRWSPRIKRDDGLLRIVPGLGTRAVDRLADDYPVLVAPGQPGLRVNVTPEEMVRYSPKKIDVIDLETNRFETVEARKLVKEIGYSFPALTQLISIYEHDRIRRASFLEPNFDPDRVVFTFEGLFETAFLAQMRSLLSVLSDSLDTPVDIEFASDGRDLYLLQCRPQSHSRGAAPTPIPRDLPENQVLFSAHRYVSNGVVPEVTHVVYVDLESYSSLESLEDMREVGRAVGRLNTLLPKRQFVLMGPGRWGSRGDIRLGVSVTYADINNTAVLIEIARKKGNYVPDLSFGTHFFQDLVESGIRYLPLYPDDPGVVFNELFLKRSPNVLADLLPEFARFHDTIRVIDIPRATQGLILRVLMNGDLDEAVGIFASPGTTDIAAARSTPPMRPAEDHWRWRLRMAQRIAADIDPARFGVKGLYVYGSTKNATAGPGSDIDLLVHFSGSEAMRRELTAWLDGWSLSLAEMNYLRTGYRSDGLLDARIITDEDIAQQTSYAAKIGAVTDAARPLTIGGQPG